MSAPERTATASTTTTEEDWFRRYNTDWRDTAVGRLIHVATCPRSSHRDCGGTR